MKKRTKLIWDGEKIKQSTIVEDEKFAIKEFLDGIAQAKNQLDSIKKQKEELVETNKQLDKQIRSIKDFILEREDLEEKALEINKKKLLNYIERFTPQLKKEAEEEVKEEVSKDENAYTKDQIKNLYYVTFQRKLATHPKVAKNICKKVFDSDLYEEPVFKNPFEEISTDLS